MKKFVYKAWDEEFNMVKGIIEESDIDRATENIKIKGLKIVYVKEKRGLSTLGFLKKDLNEETLVNFCGQIAMIISSGANLLNGLEIMEQQTKNKNMKKIIGEIIAGIKGGSNLAEAMREAGSFPILLTDMVMTGEISGNLDIMLFNMESFYKREANIKNKIKSASIYPLVILVVSIGMMLFFNFFIFPDLKNMFADTKLPLITILLLGIMNYINSNYLFLILVIILGAILMKYIATIPNVKYFIDKTVLRIPSVGLVKTEIITSRFTRSMGIFLKSAVPIMTIMENMKIIIGNEFIARKIENAKNEIVGGMNFADAIGNENVFDPLVTQMMRVGEETGKLDDMMLKLADKYDERAEIGISRLMSLLEPVLTLVIGILVGVVILGMALPIMQMTQSMKQ